jgi:hypothetical protein
MPRRLEHGGMFFPKALHLPPEASAPASLWLPAAGELWR